MNSKIQFKRILIVNIFGIGDVLFTTPLISNIKKDIPDAFIGYVCNKRTAPLLENNPQVNKIFLYEKDDFVEVSRRSKIELMKKIFSLFREIKKEKFDLVIDLSLFKYASFFLMLAGIKVRIGFNYKNRSPFLTKEIKLMGYENRHVVEYYLDLLKEIGFLTDHKTLQVFVKDKDLVWAQDFLSRNGISPKERLFGIFPGGGASWGKDAGLKRWPAERFSQLADKIIEKFSVKVILLGNQAEQDICRQVANGMKQKGILACGEYSLGQSLALLKQCSWVVTNDGGPLHMAVGLGVKTVSIFGPVDENVYGPYPKANHVVASKRIACRPCYRRFKLSDCQHHGCLRDLQVEEVFKVVTELAI